MSAEKELIKKRGSYKGRITAFSTYLNSLNISSLSPTDITELELRIGKIKSLYDQFDEVQIKLECTVDNLDAQLSERNDFESSYYKLLAKGQGILNKYSTERDSMSVASNYSKHNIVKLPTIQLPKFGGSYEHWLEFHDTFSSLIHCNSEIDNINKFHYLRASLEGTAAVVIKSIEFSAKNYEIAWNLLCDRFNNKRLLIHNHVSALLNIEPITKESSINIKRLIDTLNKNLRALESLGEPVTHWDTLLIHIISSKLDSKTFREWEEYKGHMSKDDNITLEYFNTLLRNRADLCETLELSRNSNQGHGNLPSKHHKYKSMVSIQNSSHSHSTDSVQSINSCPMCNSYEHNLNTCSQFIALDNKARMQLLPTFKVCFNCFNTGHFANRCKRQGCKVCKRKHHTMIHINDFTRKCNTAPLQTDCIANNMQPDAPVSNSVALLSNLTLTASVDNSSRADSAQHVLLSTAMIKIRGRNHREYTARAVLDSGSTSCLITERMFKKLNVPPIDTNKSVLGINNISTNIQRSCDLTIRSLNNYYSNNIRCFVLPSITESLPSGNINLSRLNIPSNILLADPSFHSPADIDLIIGADIFWDILGTQKIYLGKGKPILYESKLGWLVSGPIYNDYFMQLTNKIKCNYANINFNDSSNFDYNSQTNGRVLAARGSLS